MATDSLRQATTGSDGGFLGRLGTRLRQLVCGLHGHDDLLHFEQGHISLQCVSCGYQSPGWDVKQAAQRPEAASTARPARRARILRLPVTGQRHVA